MALCVAHSAGCADLRTATRPRRGALNHAVPHRPRRARTFISYTGVGSAKVILCFVHFAPASTAVEDLVPEASLLSAEQKDCEHSSPWPGQSQRPQVVKLAACWHDVARETCIVLVENLRKEALKLPAALAHGARADPQGARGTVWGGKTYCGAIFCPALPPGAGTAAQPGPSRPTCVPGGSPAPPRRARGETAREASGTHAGPPAAAS